MNYLVPIMTFLGTVAANTTRALLPIVVMFVPIWFFERRQGSDTSRYRRRPFAHDVAYHLFYESGAFGVLGASLVFGLVQNQLGFMRLGLFEGLPVVAVGVLYIVLHDFIAYWGHRAEHSIPFLWQFHSVHHAPEEISFITSARVHPFPRLMWGVIDVVLLILLGVSPTLWFPFALVRIFLVSVQHADLGWTYGRLYPFFVSPVFHRLHHSRDRRDFDRNYSSLFGIWDYLFGTANPSRTPPVGVGVEGQPPEPTLLGQLWGPFRRLIRPGVAPGLPSGAPAAQNGRKKRALVARL
jgi:sterol desaturase/sphingolipid hydroxylase (fatty acid hydroxylase superfamily)